MENSNTMQHTNRSEKRNGLLYPLLLIAAIAVIIFSVVGIATMMGIMPSALSKNGPPAAEPAAKNELAGTADNNAGAATNVASNADCPDCGVVDSIRPVEVRGQGSGIGAVAGGVIGGILGNQIGAGRGRTAMTVVGAGAGAYAGHEVERNMNRTVRYQVRVRMNDGSYRTFYEASHPALSIGQRVRVTNRGIVAAD